MKVVILAGGYGTRLSEETVNIPKPMVEIGGKPILWHIMKIYSHYGYNDFIICLGYKGYIIKEYFMNYFMHMSDITVDLSNGGIKVHNSKAENWKVTLVDTGLDTMTGGRIKRIKDHLDGERFMLTYGDGVGNVNINSLVEFHESHGKLVTMTAVQPSGRFGALRINDEKKVESFVEKPAGDGAWINGGFFVLEPQVIDYIKDDNTIWEREPLENLTKESQLFAYKHEGFWKPMDTLRDKIELERLWSTKEAPWKVW
ncbi:glucose-1-phosphate cytidylyltransferase [Petrotoga sp. 9T1HF07.CasAA.8.2]|uniref:glucose-1-phosphate cytidylyltransferase n=1 Tax=Petrotoga sp. 9T1HF07.CasAA.8.2 TaxID=1434329 RepID=UPI000CBE9F22|nr:glucose-1-phosphate cytidylyltransferase [Petrotoga sp. 9T1HF07.CasAA.8.2]PNR88779.1 glucose-1-phosphate cytidylyltransferase [Petrotoga sp. 9T1HF07.CasAA.8.2]